MRFFIIAFFLFTVFFVKGQSLSHYKKRHQNPAFLSWHKSVLPSNSKKARTAFTTKMLNTNACISTNYGCAAAVPLSVSDLKFGGERTSETNVLLNWSTAEEINNMGFEIQRKIGNVEDFEKIGFTNAIEQKSSENKYEFLDINEANDITYYRLKIIENDGKFIFSKIIAVNSFDNSLALKVASNPIIGEEIVLQIFGLKSSENVNFTIFDALGRKISDTNQSVSKNNNSIKFPKNSDFKIGRYFVKASFKDKILLNNFVIAL